ncbi:MAG: glycogen/starch synthase, partial [bacterium]|nr:glycogen/starch synthase [bacterium]
MRIAFVSPEVYPFSKTGGLADVASALPKALGALGHEVRVFTPLHSDARKRIEQLGLQSERHVLLNYLWIGDHQRQV